MRFRLKTTTKDGQLAHTIYEDGRQLLAAPTTHKGRFPHNTLFNFEAFGFTRPEIAGLNRQRAVLLGALARRAMAGVGNHTPPGTPTRTSVILRQETKRFQHLADVAAPTKSISTEKALGRAADNFWRTKNDHTLTTEEGYAEDDLNLQLET